MIIDFHSHFLPCIDDGSKSTEMSLEMLKKMKGQNVDTVVATPHFYADENRIDDFLSNRENAYNSIKNEINNMGINVKLGAEVTYFQGISKANEIKKLTTEGTSILLLELPFDKWDNSIIEEVDYLINKRKFTVLLAHLDRYISISENKKYIKKLVKMPLVVQINAGSILDNKRKKKTYSLIKKCDKIVLGSDCHNLTSRKPNLLDCRNILSDDLGEKVIFNIDIFSEEFLFNGGK